MSKVLVAISDDFTRRSYVELLRQEKIQVLETRSGREAIEIAMKEKPDLILADTRLFEIGGIEVLKYLQQIPAMKKIPVLIFSQIAKPQEIELAMEYGARDFIEGATTLLRDVVSKIKIHLGFQKTYELAVDPKSLKIARELRKDMGYSPDIICPKCGIAMNLFLMRDLTKGKDYFKLSFTCPNCGYTE